MLASIQFEIRSDGMYRKCQYCNEYLPVDPYSLEPTSPHECHWVRHMRLAEAGRMALKALQRIEWTNAVDGGTVCPWCGNRQPDGHAPDCVREAALRMAREKA